MIALPSARSHLVCFRVGGEMERITIIGTGAVGTSLGIALKRAGVKAEIVGFDNHRGVAERAKRRGGIDKPVQKVVEAVTGARFVIIATPVLAIKDVFEFIGPELEEGAVVTDTGGTKAVVLEWAQKLLPKTVSFVGGNPLITLDGQGPDAASDTAFQNAVYPLCPLPNTHQEATKTVASMVESIGAKPYFMDAHELDGAVAAVGTLPMLLSIGLTTSTSRSASWREMHTVAAGVYKNMTQYAAGDPAVTLGVVETNRENVVRWIDETIKQLYETRIMLLEGESQKLRETFVNAQDARARWMAGVDPAPKSKIEVPTASETMSSLFFGTWITKRIGSGKESKEKEGQTQKRDERKK
jgi:prephenate dehydrogenase